jgi:hypothetical protein
VQGKPDQRSFSSMVLQISQKQAKTPPKKRKKTTKKIANQNINTVALEANEIGVI